MHEKTHADESADDSDNAEAQGSESGESEESVFVIKWDFQQRAPLDKIWAGCEISDFWLIYDYVCHNCRMNGLMVAHVAAFSHEGSQVRASVNDEVTTACQSD